MIVCVCRNVSDNIVRQLLECRCSPEQIVELTGATTRCGICTKAFNEQCEKFNDTDSNAERGRRPAATG